MDWNIFWQAFGAIGTTIGSFITAGAVIVAVMQYRQPFAKKIKIDFSAAMVNFDEEPKVYYQITFINKGIRKCTITSLYIRGKVNDLYIFPPCNIPNCNNPQFPVTLEQEQDCKMFFEYNEFRGLFKTQYENGWKPKYKHLHLYVRDSSGDTYCGKFKIKMSGLGK